MFRLNDKVVYPGHGVAKINQIVEKNIGGNRTLFYELTFLNKEMTILIPTQNTESIGIRPLSSQDEINDIVKMLAEPAKKINSYELSATNWNKKNKEYQLKLRTGDLRKIFEIYQSLREASAEKELSFGEKNLLTQTESLIAEEISIVKKLDPQKAIEYLRSVFGYVKKSVHHRHNAI